MKIITGTARRKPVFDLTLLAPLSDILFFDIETTGLRKESTQVYLIGCAYFREDCWQIRQFLAESALDEQEVMESFAEFAGNFRTLIHFNGEGFDIPYLAYKAAYYDLDFSFSDFQSIDIFLLAKPLKKLLGLPNMKQKSIERFLGIERDDPFHGGALIPVYYEFERTGDPEAESQILLHNFEDVEGMLSLTSVLDYLQIPEGAFTFSGLKTAFHTAIFEYRLKRPVPMGFETYTEDGMIGVCGQEDLLKLNIVLYEGEAHLPLPDVENYYYLPEEDRVIHKDVAAFVDKSRRRKATRKNCFLKKEGVFLPQRKELFTPAYEVEGQKRKTFFEVNADLSADHQKLTQYALDILNL